MPSDFHSEFRLLVPRQSFSHVALWFRGNTFRGRNGLWPLVVFLFWVLVFVWCFCLVLGLLVFFSAHHVALPSPSNDDLDTPPHGVRARGKRILEGDQPALLMNPVNERQSGELHLVETNGPFCLLKTIFATTKHVVLHPNSRFVHFLCNPCWSGALHSIDGHLTRPILPRRGWLVGTGGSAPAW